ncbi:MAG: ABC transporter permease subunit [Symploca sp. SIO2G7]|nr:ABC transporter permease subunit [Symploca sp. SIO2G7]
MALNVVNQLGELNPQVFREIKGRLKPRNVLITIAISLVSQLILLMSFASELPMASWDNSQQYSRYCTSSRQYSSRLCASDGLGGFEVNWQLWWQDVFIWLSLIGIFALLVVGTYMLLSDLSKEESRGTLNFLRLTPQSSPSILGGKLLGVPILLYIAVGLAFPLQLWSSVAGGVPIYQMLCFYLVIASSCLCFYSMAVLFGLVGRRLSSFQPWLGSGAVLIFLMIMTAILHHHSYNHYITDWLMLFHPGILLPHLVDANSLDPASMYRKGDYLEKLWWFYLPVGSGVGTLASLTVLNNALWSYWAWQGLKRCFHNPSANVFSKRQSYLLTACFELIIIGFALNPNLVYDKRLFENVQILVVFNLILFLGLIAALSPHRQALQDWARYRHQQHNSHNRSLLKDLLWGEKSPALVAIALNLAIASVILLTWILFWPSNEYKMQALWALLLNISFILVCATVAQLMLLMKAQKRSVWAATTVCGLIILPPIMFGFLSLKPHRIPDVWLFSAFHWVGVEHAIGASVGFALIAQSLTLAVLNLQLTRRLQKAGESATKALSGSGELRIEN